MNNETDLKEILQAIYGLLINEENRNELIINYSLLKQKYDNTKFEHFDSYMDYCEDDNIINMYYDKNYEMRQIAGEVINYATNYDINSLREEITAFLKQETNKN